MLPTHDQIMINQCSAEARGTREPLNRLQSMQHLVVVPGIYTLSLSVAAPLTEVSAAGHAVRPLEPPTFRLSVAAPLTELSAAGGRCAAVGAPHIEAGAVGCSEQAGCVQDLHHQLLKGLPHCHICLGARLHKQAAVLPRERRPLRSAHLPLCFLQGEHRCRCQCTRHMNLRLVRLPPTLLPPKAAFSLPGLVSYNAPGLT